MSSGYQSLSEQSRPSSLSLTTVGKLHSLGDEVGSGRLHACRLCSRDALLRAVSSFLSSSSRSLAQALT